MIDYEEFAALGASPDAARAAAAALNAAMNQGPVNPLPCPWATAEALGALEDPDQAPSELFKDAACVLEWGNCHWGGTFGRLPRAGGWHSSSLPKEIEEGNFVWARVHTEGAGNGGRWVPAKPKTAAARALLSWFRAQTTVPFYGGYWWEAADSWGFAGMDEVADAVRRFHGVGGAWPRSCADAEDMHPNFRSMSGPRMWAFVDALDLKWSERDSASARRLRKEATRRRRNLLLQRELEAVDHVRYVPA